jgi:hypothetical protein
MDASKPALGKSAPSNVKNPIIREACEALLKAIAACDGQVVVILSEDAKANLVMQSYASKEVRCYVEQQVFGAIGVSGEGEYKLELQNTKDYRS